MNVLNILNDAKKIYVFDTVYGLNAAIEQANKKKLSAFGMVAKFNLLNKPKDETVHSGRHELRYEPFWYIDSARKIDYTLSLERKFDIDDEFATIISIDDKEYAILSESKKHFVSDEKRFCNLNVKYNCHRDIAYKTYIDALNRNIKQDFFEKIFKNSNYTYKEVNNLTDIENIVAPKFSASSVLEEMKNVLLREKIISHEILSDEVLVEKLYLFYRPVYAFEFIWSHENRVGIIEIDGLNGEVSEKGEWFKDKINKVVTRDMMFEVSSEVANGIVPGSGIVVKIIDKITK